MGRQIDESCFLVKPGFGVVESSPRR